MMNGEKLMKNWIVYLKIALNLVLFVLGILFLVFVVPPFIKFFMPFFIGWIISMIANPLVRFLEKKVKIIRKHGTAIIIVAVILIVIGALSAITYFIGKEAVSLARDLPHIYESLEQKFQQLSANLNGLYKVLPSSVQDFVDKFSVSLSEYGATLSKSAPITISKAGNLAKNVMEGFLMTIITILSAYFFTAERDNIVREIKKIIPKTVGNYYRLVVDNFKTAVGGYFKAQFKIMLVITTIIFIGFEILKINYSFLLAIGIAFLDFLPFFGTGAVFWPWALIDVLVGNYSQAIYLMIMYLICQIVKQILQPKMVGDSIGLNPLTTLIFMFIGYRFMNVFGMIIGIPIGMAAVSLCKLGLFDTLIKGVKIIVNDINEFRKF